MISWEQAEKLSANDFAKEMLKELGSCATYKTLADLIYRSQSRMQTWCSPSSKEPLPISERHHLWCAVFCDRSVVQARESWTEEQDNFIQLNYEKMSYSKIAKELTRSEQAVTRRVAWLGLSKRTVRPFSDDEIDILKDVSLNHSECARKLKRQDSSIRNKRQKLGIIVT